MKIEILKRYTSSSSEKEPYALRLLPETGEEKNLCNGIETTEMQTISMFLNHICDGAGNNPCTHRDVCLTHNILTKNDIALSIIFFQDCEKKAYHSEAWVKWQKGG